MREKKNAGSMSPAEKMYLIPCYTIYCFNFVKTQSDFHYLYTLHLYLKHLNRIVYF